MTDPAVDPRSFSPWHARAPFGERVSAEPLLGGDFFPFEGDVRVVPLDQPIVPEPPRNGEPGGGECLRCADPQRFAIWQDDDWALGAGIGPSGLPFVAGLSTREHVTLHSMSPTLAGTMGPVIRRAALAIGQLAGVGRTHFNRWGDGSEHFHLWLLARPLGMMQLRGAFIAGWDDMLPQVPDDEAAANMVVVAAAMAAGGGEAVGAGLAD